MIHDSSVTPEMVQAVEIENNENHEACKSCGGYCCRMLGCEVFPQDVKRWFQKDEITKEMIIKLLDSGKVMLDWWEGDVREEVFGYPDEMIEDFHDRSFYLHMRGKGENAIQGSWGGEPCRMFDREKGCLLTWEQRPSGGRSLVPDPSGNRRNCSKQELSKAEDCLAWSPYHDMLEAVYEEYESDDQEDPKESVFGLLGRFFNDYREE